MPIDIKDVEHLEELARLKLSEKEKKLYATQLSSILEYMDKLQQVDVEGVESTGHATEAKSVWREDVVRGCTDEEKKRILDNAPEKSGSLFKVKKVFE